MIFEFVIDLIVPIAVTLTMHTTKKCLGQDVCCAFLFWCFGTPFVDGVYCNGGDSCHELTINDGGLCRGYATCTDSIVVGDGTNIFECHGASSCTNITTINATEINSLECGGYLSCLSMNITSNSGSFYGHGAFSGVNMILHSTENQSISSIQTHGYASFANLDATDAFVKYIYAYAYYGFYNGQIRLSNNSNVDLYGKFAAYGAHFYCPDNYYCTINCQNQAQSCYNVTFDCQTPQTCTVYVNISHPVYLFLFCSFFYSVYRVAIFTPVPLNWFASQTQNYQLTIATRSLAKIARSRMLKIVQGSRSLRLCMMLKKKEKEKEKTTVT